MTVNVTSLTPPVHPTASELYAKAGTDFSQLSTVETWWAQWYIMIGDPVIATGLLSFILHEVGPPLNASTLFLTAPLSP